MNITDFFFACEQWPWDAISTIVNICLVAALVFITALYANQVKKQTELLKKDREKNRILEGIQQVLTPSRKNLIFEIHKITNRTRIDFFQKFNEFFDRKRYYSYAFWDIIEEFTDLPEKLHDNDKLADKLNIKYNEIDKEVTDILESDNFNEHLRNMIQIFCKVNPGVFGPDREAIPELKKLCKEYIISEWNLLNDLPPLTEHKNNFLKENKDELQRYKDIPRIKEHRKKIKETLNERKKLNEDIIELFEKIIIKYRKDYHFSEDEINPDIKKEIAFLK